MDFPKSFPSNCPPENATPALGTVFRFVKADPPTANDFLSYFQLGKTLADKDKECQFHGLSIYMTESVAVEARAKVPGMRRRKIAKGRLGSDWGALIKTPGIIAEHHTWWLPTGRQGVEKLFDVVTLK